MRDFPPTVTAWTEARDGAGHRAGIGIPDTRGPVRFLWWLLRQQGDLVLAGCLCSLLWMLPTALTPWVFGQAVDEGIRADDAGRTALWCGVLLLITLVGASSGVFYHTVVVRSWLYAAYGQTRLVTHQVTRLGHVMTRRAPTGEVLSVNGSDGEQFGHFIEIFSRLVGNVVAYVLVAVIVLQISVPLGLVVLLVAPVLALVSSVLLRPMAAAQTRERSRDSELTSMATDIVAGLRILRGIGGERIFGANYARQSQRVRQAGVQAGSWGAFVEAVGVLLSACSSSRSWCWACSGCVTATSRSASSSPSSGMPSSWSSRSASSSRRPSRSPARWSPRARRSASSAPPTRGRSGPRWSPTSSAPWPRASSSTSPPGCGCGPAG
ncbi:ABC transporter transmembrane domain-containing protein [Serinicoccus marinus]|uniref:ABC transporter transmembrane domain-containing protein n=1 Tax=Serinicoccus marinus TaxID=247333 RepID=UPI00122E53F1|nr:ABC transporter transmembrane domain-containing protein [Serinicoccus marinus]